jgi:hypothetical protein
VVITAALNRNNRIRASAPGDPDIQRLSARRSDALAPRGDYIPAMAFHHFVAATRATEEFKLELARYADGLLAGRIQTVRHAPRVKVLRVLAQLLEVEPDLEIERVSIDAWSGCSDYRGTIAVTTSDSVLVFRFRWDCSWRAEQEGWLDAFQLPDQIRAAHEFGWRCFAEWRRESTVPTVILSE